MKPQYFLITIAAVSLYFLSDLFAPFLKPIIVAVLLAVATSSIYDIIKNKIKSNMGTTICMTIILSAVFFIPLIYFIFNIVGFVNSIDQEIVIKMFGYAKNLVQDIPDEYSRVKDQLELLLAQVDVPVLIEKIISFAAFVGKNSASFMIDMVMILIFYFFINLYKTSLSTYLIELVPLNHEDGKTLFMESSNVMSIVLYSILVTAVFEGLLFGIFINFFGFDGILLGVLYGFASLIPVIGGMLMWVPLAGYEIFEGNFSNAIIIVSYSIIVISLIADTIIKPIIIKYINLKVVKNPTKINELLIFFSIVAGLSTFGFWGMIIGPAMVTIFISIMQLLKKYSNDVL
ncbi:MAG: AI-2E family transporter [Campylobacteraceae bacterium]|nr:AI-2E family transporter [Campylobacteraceae bacterium]